MTTNNRALDPDEERTVVRDISLRCYVPPMEKKAAKKYAIRNTHHKHDDRGYGREMELVIDTEELPDLAHQLRFGIAHLYKSEKPARSWIFYDPHTPAALNTERLLSAEELAMLQQFADDHGTELLTVDDFMDQVFYRYVQGQKVTDVGANLFFDHTRLAVSHGHAQGANAGGFRLRLNRNRPLRQAYDIIAKSLGGKKSLLKLSPASGGYKRKWGRPYQGCFVDVLQLGKALLAQSHSLKSLADFLKVAHPKLDTDEHGQKLTRDYLNYAWNDVVTTYECFLELRKRWKNLNIKKTEINHIYSEASIAKAFLKEAGIKTLRDVQPELFSEHPDIIGKIMQTFYGGRVAAYIRRVKTRALYADATSMYPTVAILLGLDRFLIAKGIMWRDATGEVQAFLDKVASLGVDALADKSVWPQMIGIAKIRPNRDMVPCRCRERDEGAGSDNIVLAELSRAEPVWYALPDLAASAAHTRRAPQIIEALKFEPLEPQSGLLPITLPDGSTINPYDCTIFKSLIELRLKLKNEAGELEKELTNRPVTPTDHTRLDELAMSVYMLKIVANSLYGILVELNEHLLVRPRGIKADIPDEIIEDSEGPLKQHWAKRISYSGDHAFVAEIAADEIPGSRFHPLLGTLITSAARLMLSCGEICATREDWPDPIISAYCDTDAWLLARPDGLPEDRFLERCRRVSEWYNQINPYNRELISDLFKYEDVNYKPGSKTDFQPLYLYAVSSKRYVVFNDSEDGQHPVIRKASAHGLGWMMDPYPDDSTNPALPPLPSSTSPKKIRGDLGVKRWQHDLWYLILDSVVYGHGDYIKRLTAHPGLKQPAIARHTVRTAQIDKWFEGFNRNKEYRHRIRPGGFISAWSPAAGPTDLLWALHPDMAPERIYKEGSRLKTYENKLRNIGLSQEQIDDAIDREPEEWRPIAPFSNNIKEILNNSFDRITGLPVPPWVQPQTYAHVLWNFDTFPERKFVNGNECGLMIVPHIVAAETHHVGKATNRLDEAEILELAETGEFVNEYTPESRMVPARRARELLAPLLHKPARKALAEDQKEAALQNDEIPVPDNRLSADELEALHMMMRETQLSRRQLPIEQWFRNSTNYIITDFGRLSLTEAASEIGVSKTYLIDIISGRWKNSAKVPLTRIVADNLARRPVFERDCLPSHEIEDPDIDALAGRALGSPSLECSDEMLAGLDQVEQLTDGTPKSFEYKALCEIMLFNHWERRTIPTQVGGILHKEIISSEAASLLLDDFDSMFDYLSEIVAPENNDDILSPDDIG